LRVIRVVRGGYAARAKSTRTAVGVLAAAVVLLFAVATPAGAAPGGASPTAATSAPGATRHCVLRAVRGAVPAEPRCFGSFRAAISWASGGRVTDAREQASVAATDPAFAARLREVASTAVAILGIEYADANYRGATLTLTAAGGCDSSLDVDWQFASLPSSWNDRISSFRSYSNCLQRLFRDVNFGTAITPIQGSSPWVGSAANDKASSIRFY